MALDNFQTNLMLLAAQHPKSVLLQKMGYSKPGEKTLERLRATLSSPNSMLDTPSYDFRYSQPQFLQALCEVLGISRSKVEQHIAKVKARLDSIANAFKPYVWVDTEFKRESEPLAVLAMIENQRYIHFPDTFYLHSLDVQLDLAGERAALYYQQTNGVLPMWGSIKRFRYYVADNEAYVLDTNGKMIGKHQGPVDNKAGVNGEAGAVVDAANREAPKPGEY